MKWTIRDLFWLALLVAGVTAWGIEQVRAARGIWHRHVIGSESDHPNFHIRERKWRAALDIYAQMTDEEVDAYFGSLPASKLLQFGENHFDYCDEYEPCLVEMARRGMAGQLQKHYDALMAQSAGKTGFDFPENLELLTALRRAQGKPDPLKIHLKFEGGPVLLSQFQKPRFSAVIENVDSNGEAVSLEQGGDYRGGRLDKWRFELIDEKGRVVSGLNLLGGGDGMSQRLPLQYGGQSSWSYKFDLQDYLAPPPGGKYKLRALYHNDVHISGLSDVDGLIVTKSTPIPVVVHSRSRMGATHPRFRMPLPLGVLLACLAVTIASIVVNSSRRLGISRRDFRWGLIIIALSVGMWLSDESLMRSNSEQVRRMDLREWSIRLVDEN
jgi:hypothetical protein